jgi:hypothetical protein
MDLTSYDYFTITIKNINHIISYTFSTVFIIAVAIVLYLLNFYEKKYNLHIFIWELTNLMIK